LEHRRSRDDRDAESFLDHLKEKNDVVELAHDVALRAGETERMVGMLPAHPVAVHLDETLRGELAELDALARRERVIGGTRHREVTACERDRRDSFRANDWPTAEREVELLALHRFGLASSRSLGRSAASRRDVRGETAR
jgi:hypothetical protein